MNDFEVIVIGAGFSGIATAIKLRELGIDDHVVLEAGDDVGGTWHWNRYPGVAVDIPTWSYQFSFDQRQDWSRVYAPGSELRAYAQDVVAKHDLRSKMRFGVKVVSSSFGESTSRWTLTTEAGETLTARFVVLATGVLTQPKNPDIPGVEDFAGITMHTARWDHSVDLRGKRVGVIGTGASAVQLIPEIAGQVEHLTVFQRTPIWCLPKADAPIGSTARRVLDRIPGGHKLARAVSQSFVEFSFPLAAHYPKWVPVAGVAERVARRELRRQVKDPVVREKLTPNYTLGCKRPSFHNSFLSTFNRPNVTLETTPITHIAPGGVHVQGDASHDLDVLVLATGFKVFERGNMPPFPVAGRGGQDLDAFWDEHRYQAYEGTSVPGYPNLFFILGPYGYNAASYFTLIENQMRHIGRCLTHARASGASTIEVTREANDRYFAESLAGREGQVFFRGSCSTANSYYFDPHGDVPFRRATTPQARWRSDHFDLADYRLGFSPGADDRTAVASDPGRRSPAAGSTSA